jgi:UPF0755 protein
MPSRLIRPLAAAVVAVLVVGLAAWCGFRSWLDAPLVLGKPMLVELPEGSNLTNFLSELEASGVLMHPTLLRLHARATTVANRVRAGEYRLEHGLSARQLLANLVAGEVVEYEVTIVEGATLAQLLERLREQPKLRSDAALDSGNVLAAIGEDGGAQSAEGLFFPDTYQFHKGMRDIDILSSAHRRMAKILAEEWDQRDADLPYTSAYEALVMASLIERETGLAAERREIAGVFVRRLRHSMLLQTDPAVIYGLGKEFDGNLTRRHLQLPGPYNTYMNPGLPPTPIALPGRAAIHAALHPAAGDALYFVARGDGSHQFSATLEQHNRAVREFQLRRGKGGGAARGKE